MLQHTGSSLGGAAAFGGTAASFFDFFLGALAGLAAAGAAAAAVEGMEAEDILFYERKMSYGKKGAGQGL